MKKSILLKRIFYIRHQINNTLITEFGLSEEKAKIISLGPDPIYSQLTGDHKKVEHVNKQIEEVTKLEALLNRP